MPHSVLQLEQLALKASSRGAKPDDPQCRQIPKAQPTAAPSLKSAHEYLRSAPRIHDLFGAFVANPRLLPPQYQAMAATRTIERTTADYIVGMTDRYSMREHRRLFAVSEF